MLYDLVKEDSFGKLMRGHIEEILIYLFEQEQNFGILCKVEYLEFEPELPVSISSEFRPMTLFFLAGYTFESARIEDNVLVFEAGFGNENIGSVVTVPLLSIMQIIIDETPIFVNMATPSDGVISSSIKESSSVGVENSMASFLSNPENQKFLKK
ncbi:MAG: hypothetical protein U9N42_02000 [Campylobacterota bacterium]|nr:hypothetical protein [Campylobacterota bacterium]